MKRNLKIPMSLKITLISAVRQNKRAACRVAVMNNNILKSTILNYFYVHWGFVTIRGLRYRGKESGRNDRLLWHIPGNRLCMFPAGDFNTIVGNVPIAGVVGIFGNLR